MCDAMDSKACTTNCPRISRSTDEFRGQACLVISDLNAKEMGWRFQAVRALCTVLLAAAAEVTFSVAGNGVSHETPGVTPRVRPLAVCK